MAKLTSICRSVRLAASSAGLGSFLVMVVAGDANAQGQDPCIYADQNYSHGAIFAGTRCNDGIWVNLSVAEFRRLYPNGLGGAGTAAPTGDGSGREGEEAAAQPPSPSEPD